MKAEHYLKELTRSIKDVASSAEGLIYGTYNEKQWKEIYESVLVVHCFSLGVFRESHKSFELFFEKKFENKKGKKKKDAAFYTPAYISNYIVEKTIGPLITKIEKDKRVKDKVKKISKLTICDPCMGGGIFLVSAQDFVFENLIMLNEKYTIEQLADFSLKTIYGVDINPDAVDFCKFILNVNTAKWKMLEKFDEFVISAGKISL